jgi:hypothetical protein
MSWRNDNKVKSTKIKVQSGKLKVKSGSRFLLLLFCFISPLFITSCHFYSLSGAATTAKTIQIDQFYNNTDLGPANLGQDLTNKLKDYYQRNSNLKVTPENGELQIEGTIVQYSVSPIAPVANNDPSRPTQAALTRLTIGVKANYVDTKEPKNSFKDKTFSFYADFPNEQDLISVQQELEKKIFDQIFLDIFNATIANW